MTSVSSALFRHPPEHQNREHCTWQRSFRNKSEQNHLINTPRVRARQSSAGFRQTIIVTVLLQVFCFLGEENSHRPKIPPKHQNAEPPEIQVIYDKPTQP